MHIDNGAQMWYTGYVGLGKHEKPRRSLRQTRFACIRTAERKKRGIRT